MNNSDGELCFYSQTMITKSAKETYVAIMQVSTVDCHNFKIICHA